MTTLIQGGHIIAYDGSRHTLIENGVIVYDQDKILHVGKSYSGPVDERIEARGKIVAPGFINTHCHMGTPLNSEAYVIDTDQRLVFGNPNIPLAPVKSKLALKAQPEEVFLRVAEFTLSALVKSGCTTIVDMGAGRDSLAELVGRMGLRAYLGPGYRSAETYTGDDGTLYNKDWDEERGLRGLDNAKRFVEKYDGAFDGRVKGMLIPMQADTCTPTLFKETRKAANELGCLVGTHVSQRIMEFQEILRKYKKTPIEFLNSVGLLGPDTLVGHAMFVSGHYGTAYPGDGDIEVLAKTGTTVAHCPLVVARTGWALQSFKRYLDAGVNMTIGCDTWPLDIISEMRWASILGKIVERDRSASSSIDVYNATTLNAAKAVGRSDIGRLVKGGKADIIVLDTGNFRYVPIADPVKSIVNAGTCDDVETVIVAGRKLVENKRLVDVDEAKLMQDVSRMAEEMWKKVPETDWANRSIYDIGPRSLPLDEES